MVTASIGFLIMQTGAQTASIVYMKEVIQWLVGSDLLLTTFFQRGTSYLNEGPISNFLDSLMVAQADNARPIVSGYSFVTTGMADLIGDEAQIAVKDLSEF